MQLKGKLFINGKIKALTGLHIGGSKADVAIGDIDNCVIKTSEGVPYIPGSSLKGKIRSLLEKSDLERIKREVEAKSRGKGDKSDNKENPHLCSCGKKGCKICVIFGTGADKRETEAGPTRLIVRDAHLREETKKKMENRAGELRELELIYTESKWENTINRLTSKADNPRQTERVPQGAEFDFQMVFNVMEEEDLDRFYYLTWGLCLLEDDYLGGSGSRGYGRIEFKDLQIAIKTLLDYENNNVPGVLYKGDLSDFHQNKDEFMQKLKDKLEMDSL